MPRNPLWDEDMILEGIKKMDADGVGLTVKDALRYNSKLYHAAFYWFGSWKAAKDVAGVEMTNARGLRAHNLSRWSRPDIIRMIKKRVEDGLELAQNIAYKEDPCLVRAASSANMFGSWDNALRAAGIAPKAVQALRRWTPEEFKATMLMLAATGVRMNAQSVKRRDGYLYKLGMKYYENWPHALRACGLPSTDPIRASRKKGLVINVKT